MHGIEEHSGGPNNRNPLTLWEKLRKLELHMEEIYQLNKRV